MKLKQILKKFVRSILHMSSDLTKIKSKIKSTKTTKKITKAMELVAASKMKVFQDKALNSKKFEVELETLLGKTLDYDFDNIYSEVRDEGKTLFVLYTSDRGLCGGMNIKLIKTLLDSEAWKRVAQNQKTLITIGKKGFDFARYNNLKVDHSFQNLSEEMHLSEVLEIIDRIVRDWDQGHVKEVYMVSPNFINSMLFYPKVERFLPIGAKILEDSREDYENEFNHNLLYEPNSQEFLQNLVQQIIYTKFLASFMELKATEYSSRMLAMKNATKNAGEIIQNLTLSYNNARQALITQEIVEIIGGDL